MKTDAKIQITATATRPLELHLLPTTLINQLTEVAQVLTTLTAQFLTRNEKWRPRFNKILHSLEWNFRRSTINL